METISVNINGKTRTIDTAGHLTLIALLQYLEVRSDRVAVEYNGEIVPRELWPEQVIASGDRLEVVHFVGGGA